MSHDSSGTWRRRLSGTRGGASGDRPAQPRWRAAGPTVLRNPPLWVKLPSVWHFAMAALGS